MTTPDNKFTDPATPAQPSIALRDGALEIDGTARVILCASLFPFRIPAEQWETRIRAVRSLGYHCLDVYVPWNHHEVNPGEYEFSGHRDLAAFLDLAAKHELMVLVRPGPYICSEFDGGALPARLSTVPGLRARQLERRYLAEVAGWFAAVLPIIAARQWPRGGPVIMVQLENELDFHDCEEPAEYVAALRDLAISQGIEVPLIACAGQGDIHRAGGTVDRVAPAVNLYPDDESLDVALVAREYVDHLRSRRIPPLVTETNRLHRTLKRLLGSGVVFLGPYLQASGWNFDDDGATNNWGAPLAFMTSDYDFGGAIAPDGTERADAHRGRLLGRFIDALGERLARATPHGCVTVTDRVETAELALRGGGLLRTITNLSGSARCAETTAGAVQLAPGETRLIVDDMPLTPEIHLSTTGELFELTVDRNSVRVVVQAAGSQSVNITGIGNDTPPPTDQAAAVKITQACGSLTITGHDGTVDAVLSDGRRLTVTLLDAATAGAWNAPSPRGLPVRRSVTSEGLWLSTRNDVHTTDLGEHETPLPWEVLGIARGFGSYRTELPAQGHHHLLLTGASDVVSLHSLDRHTAHIAVGGQDLVLPWPATGRKEALEVRTMTWGHSNFNDSRLPALGLSSQRGLTGAAALGPTQDISGRWRVKSMDPRVLVGVDPAPLADFGGWSTSRRPVALSYSRDISIPPGHDAVALTLSGLQARVEVFIDDRPLGLVTPLTPTLDLSASATPGHHRLELRVNRTGEEDPGRPKLATGHRISGWTMEHTNNAELHAAAAAAARQTVMAELPLYVPPGERRWLTLDLTTHLPFFDATDIVLRLDGDGLFVRVLAGGRGVGRIWTSVPRDAHMKGGRGDVALVPAPWVREEPKVTMLLEATEPSGGVLRSLTLSNEIDLEAAQ